MDNLDEGETQLLVEESNFSPQPSPSNDEHEIAPEDKLQGSINHILRTAFKDVFATPLDTSPSMIGKKPTAVGNLESPEIPNVQSADENTEKGGTMEEEINDKEAFLGEEPADEIDADIWNNEDVEELQIDESMFNEEVNEEKAMSPQEFQAIKTQPKVYHIPEEVSKNALEHIDNITDTLAKRNSQAKNILEVLEKSMIKAKEEDQIDDVKMKQRGLIMNVHIPIGSSHFNVPKSKVEEAGEMAKDLLDAHAILEANLDTKLKRAGQRPVAENLNKKSLEELLKEEPHYYEWTSNLTNRKEVVKRGSTGLRGLKNPDLIEIKKELVRNQGIKPTDIQDDQILEDICSEKFEQIQKHVARVNKRIEKLNRHNSRHGKVDETQLALDYFQDAKMKHKLQFLKNPRYDNLSLSYSRSLISPVESKEISNLRPRAKDGFHHFICDPPSVEFREFEIKSAYEIIINVRNVTAVKRSFSLIPPTTAFFSVEKIVYPSRSNREIASGISAAIKVRFMPQYMADCDDVMYICCESGKIPIPIQARRLPPQLDIPKVFETGICMIGNYIDKTFHIKNNGGKGKFSFFKEEEYPYPSNKRELSTSLFTGPFEIFPSSFDLEAGEEIDVQVKFVPTEVGVHNRGLILLCDNCTTMKVGLSGKTTEVGLLLHSVDKSDHIVGFDAIAESNLNRIYFPKVPVGGAKERIFTLQNEAEHDITFKWKLDEKIDSSLGNIYSISPNEGYMPSKSTVDFKIKYMPDAPGKVMAKFNLILLDLPKTCVPLPGQSDALHELQEMGSERCFRLKNWIRKVEMEKKEERFELYQRQIEEGVEDIVPYDEDELARMTPSELRDTILKDICFEGSEHPLRHEIHRVIDKMLDEYYQEEGFEKNEIVIGEGFIRVSSFLSRLSSDIRMELNKYLANDFTSSLQPIPRTDISTLPLIVEGSGNDVLVRVKPSVDLSLQGPIRVGSAQELHFTLKNESTTNAYFSWEEGLSLLKEELSFDDGLDINSSNCETELSAEVTIEPVSGIIPSLSTLSCKLFFTPRKIGKLQFVLKNNVVGASSPLCPYVQVNADVIPPRIRFQNKEVDFGLLSVGGLTEETLSFKNESEIPIHWDLCENMNGLESDEDDLSARSGSSSISRATEDSMNGGLTAKSTITYEPEKGVLQPGAVQRVTLKLKAGKAVERLRGRISCNVRDTLTSRTDGINSQLISYRGEVQELKVYLSTMEVDLDTVYTKVPVKRTMYLKNISNLTSRFKFEKPMEGNSNYQFDINPSSGELREKETVKIELTFKGENVGNVEELYGCKIKGMKHPLGFMLKAAIKGVTVAYELLNEGQRVPKPVAPVNEPQLPSDCFVPLVAQPPRLNFGKANLFERKTKRFVIRNFSAVPAAFRITSRLYPVAGVEVPGTSYSTNSLKSTPSTASLPLSYSTTREGGYEKARKGGTLSSVFEEENKFKTSKGHQSLNEEKMKMEDREILKDNRGFAVLIEPASGMLTPWGVTAVTIKTFNNMDGEYDDDIQCYIKGLPITRLKLNETVVGSALTIKSNCVGIDLLTNPSMPNLSFGVISAAQNVMSKTITVVNKGPMTGRLNWKIIPSSIDSDRTPLCDVKIKLNEDGKIKLNIMANDKPIHPIYSINPEGEIIPGYRERQFTVSMRPPKSCGKFTCRLVLDADWYHPSTTLYAIERNALPNKRMESAVRLTASVETVTPWVMVDKRKHTEEVGNKQYLKFELPMEELTRTMLKIHKARRSIPASKNMSSNPALLKLYRNLPESLIRKFTIANPLPMFMSFTLKPTDPFTIISSDTLIPINDENVYTLRPSDSMTLTIAYLPSTAEIDSYRGLKTEKMGQLTVNFSTGQEQVLYLRAVIMRPMVILAPSFYDFGFLNVEETKEIMLYLTNPTLIPAKWKLVHIPTPAPKRPAFPAPWHDLGKPVPIDDPSVFQFSEYKNIQDGPSAPLASSGATLPVDINRLTEPTWSQSINKLTWQDKEDKAVLDIPSMFREKNKDNTTRIERPIQCFFKPKTEGLYRCRFRLEVEDGEGFDFVVSGFGTWEENLKANPPPHI